MADTLNAELVYNLMRDYNGGKDLFTTPYADFVPTTNTIPPKPLNDGLAKGIVMYENHAVKVDVKPMPGLYLNTIQFDNGDYEDAVRAIDKTNNEFFKGFDFAYDALAEERYERKRKTLMESEALLNYAKERDDWREQERRIAFNEYGLTADEYEAMVAKEKVDSAVKMFKEGRKGAMGIKAKLEETIEEGKKELDRRPIGGRPTITLDELRNRLETGADFDPMISMNKMKELARIAGVSISGKRDKEEVYSILRDAILS